VSKNQAVWVLLMLYFTMLAAVICAVFLGVILHRLGDPHGLPVHLIPSGTRKSPRP